MYVCIDYMAVGCVLVGSTATTAATDTDTVTLDLLAQLVNYTSLYDKLHSVVVVIILNDADRRSAEDFLPMIMTKYLYEVSIGYIHILQQGRLVV